MVGSQSSQWGINGRLQQVESKLKTVEERLQTYEPTIPHVPNGRLWEQLQEKQDIIERSNKRIEEANTEVKSMQDRLQKAHCQVEEFQTKLQDILRSQQEEN